jgi:hypothetical protein
VGTRRGRSAVFQGCPPSLQNNSSPLLRDRNFLAAISVPFVDHRTMDMSPGTVGLSYGNSPSSARSHGFKRPNDSDDEQDDGGPDGRMAKAARQAAVKRACNECRQQKVRDGSPLLDCRCSMAMRRKSVCILFSSHLLTRFNSCAATSNKTRSRSAPAAPSTSLPV